MHTRRRLLAAIAILAALPGSALARVRGVYDARVSVDNWWSRGLTCSDPLVRRTDGAIVVQLDCESIPSAKIPKRGFGIYLSAEAKYTETGIEIGDCWDVTRSKKRGPISASCTIPLPPQLELPIVIEGNGPGVSAPVQLPGGSLVFETSASVVEYRYGSLDLNLPSGSEYELWDSWDEQPTVFRVEFFRQAVEAVVTSTVDGPWRVVVDEAFP